MATHVDFLICSLPMMSVDRPPAAPALLKSTAETAGFTSAALDLSINFFVNQCDSNLSKLNTLSACFNSYEPPTEQQLAARQAWLEQSLDLIASYNPKVVGLSIFSSIQHSAAAALSYAIRKNMPDVKIIFGGYGLKIVANGLKHLQVDNIFNKLDMYKPFSQLVREKNLGDYLVLDDPLNQLVDILNTVVGKDSKLELFNESKVMFDWPIPNYDDYNLNHYVWNEGVDLPITGSKGCVRSCTFCDVPGQFGRFKFRSGENIANEILFLHKKYNVNMFNFTDSLVNGSFKAFYEWLEIIADYNDSRPEEEKISWVGQYICRSQKQTPKNLYSLMKRSGVKNLVIGVESGSNAVLEAMKKGMTVEDVYDEMEKFKEFGISVQVLLLSGFYNETWDRFLETLEFIAKCQPYAACGVINKISVGTPLMINNEIYLSKAADELGIILDKNDDLNWTLRDDPSNNLIERSRRRLITQILLDKLHIPQSEIGVNHLYTLFSNLKSKLSND